MRMTGRRSKSAVNSTQATSLKTAQATSLSSKNIRKYHANKKIKNQKQVYTVYANKYTVMIYTVNMNIRHRVENGPCAKKYMKLATSIESLWSSLVRIEIPQLPKEIRNAGLSSCSGAFSSSFFLHKKALTSTLEEQANPRRHP